MSNPVCNKQPASSNPNEEGICPNCRALVLRMIQTYSAGWLPNGSSKAVADAIQQQVLLIPGRKE